MYSANELNNHNMDFESVMNLPFPLFYDYIRYQAKEQRKAMEKQRRDMNKPMTITKK